MDSLSKDVNSVTLLALLLFFVLAHALTVVVAETSDTSLIHLWYNQTGKLDVRSKKCLPERNIGRIRTYLDFIDTAGFHSDQVYSPADHRSDDNQSVNKRNMVADKDLLWGTKILWTLDSSFNKTEEFIIREAIRHWEDNTCLRFIKADGVDNGPYIQFVRSDVCSSVIGRNGKGRQDIQLGKKCFTMGKIAHEIGHTLGMWHEHSRPDRDRYVTVAFDNVEDGLQPNFDVTSWDIARTGDIPYDYGSAMHYSSITFSRNGERTLIPKEFGYEQTMGQRRAMSFYDFKLINTLYCSDTCSNKSLKWSRCANDGYKHPNDCSKCACPEGFSPPFCSVLQQNELANCGVQYRHSSRHHVDVILSPVYPRGYPGPGTCYWMIMSNLGTNVVLHFEQDSALRCDKHACKDYVEIRAGDLARTGPRYCCQVPDRPIYASGNRIMVLFRSESANHTVPGFKLHYHSESCGGCIYTYVKSQRACVFTRRVSCRGNYTVQCGLHGDKTCIRYRENTCYRETFKCCKNYFLSGQKCHKMWGSWGAWSSCQTGGRQMRKRECLYEANCRGSTVQSRSCGHRTCVKPVSIHRAFQYYTSCG